MISISTLKQFLKQYIICERRIDELEQMQKKFSEHSAKYATIGKTLEMERDKLIERCADILFILGFLPFESLERQIMDSIYLKGRSLKQTAFDTGYSYGHCANVEAADMKQLINFQEVQDRIGCR